MPAEARRICTPPADLTGLRSSPGSCPGFLDSAPCSCVFLIPQRPVLPTLTFQTYFTPAHLSTVPQVRPKIKTRTSLGYKNTNSLAWSPRLSPHRLSSFCSSCNPLLKPDHDTPYFNLKPAFDFSKWSLSGLQAQKGPQRSLLPQSQSPACLTPHHLPAPQTTKALSASGRLHLLCISA